MTATAVLTCALARLLGAGNVDVAGLIGFLVEEKADWEELL